MGCVAALPFLVMLGSFFALAQDGVTVIDYVRPPASPLLPLEHERLARAPAASPHVPEQVHLTLAGPGAMAVSWLTYPQVMVSSSLMSVVLWKRMLDRLDRILWVAAVTPVFERLRSEEPVLLDQHRPVGSVRKQAP